MAFKVQRAYEVRHHYDLQNIDLTETVLSGNNVEMLGYTYPCDGGGGTLIYANTGRAAKSIVNDKQFFFFGPGADDYFERIDQSDAIAEWGGVGTLLTSSATPISFNDNGASPDTIVREDAGDWIAEGFSTEQRIEVVGSTSNDTTPYDPNLTTTPPTYYTIDAITVDTITLIAGDSLTNEASSATAIVKTDNDQDFRLQESMTNNKAVVGKGGKTYGPFTTTLKMVSDSFLGSRTEKRMRMNFQKDAAGHKPWCIATGDDGAESLSGESLTFASDGTITALDTTVEMGFQSGGKAFRPGQTIVITSALNAANNVSTRVIQAIKNVIYTNHTFVASSGDTVAQINVSSNQLRRLTFSNIEFRGVVQGVLNLEQTTENKITNFACGGISQLDFERECVFVTDSWTNSWKHLHFNGSVSRFSEWTGTSLDFTTGQPGVRGTFTGDSVNFVNGSPDTIVGNYSAGDFPSDGFVIGQLLEVTNANNSNNNGFYEITGVAASLLTLSVNTTVTNDTTDIKAILATTTPPRVKANGLTFVDGRFAEQQSITISNANDATNDSPLNYLIEHMTDDSTIWVREFEDEFDTSAADTNAEIVGTHDSSRLMSFQRGANSNDIYHLYTSNGEVRFGVVIGGDVQGCNFYGSTIQGHDVGMNIVGINGGVHVYGLEGENNITLIEFGNDVGSQCIAMQVHGVNSTRVITANNWNRHWETLKGVYTGGSLSFAANGTITEADGGHNFHNTSGGDRFKPGHTITITKAADSGNNKTALILTVQDNVITTNATFNVDSGDTTAIFDSGPLGRALAEDHPPASRDNIVHDVYINDQGDTTYEEENLAAFGRFTKTTAGPESTDIRAADFGFTPSTPSASGLKSAMAEAISSGKRLVISAGSYTMAGWTFRDNTGDLRVAAYGATLIGPGTREQTFIRTLEPYSLEWKGGRFENWNTVFNWPDFNGTTYESIKLKDIVSYDNGNFAVDNLGATTPGTITKLDVSNIFAGGDSGGNAHNSCFKFRGHQFGNAVFDSVHIDDMGSAAASVNCFQLGMDNLATVHGSVIVRNCTVKNIVSGGGGQETHALECYGPNFFISDCIFEDVSNASGSADEGVLMKSADSIITNCQFKDAGGIGSNAQLSIEGWDYRITHWFSFDTRTGGAFLTGEAVTWIGGGAGTIIRVGSSQMYLDVTTVGGLADGVTITGSTSAATGDIDGTINEQAEPFGYGVTVNGCTFENTAASNAKSVFTGTSECKFLGNTFIGGSYAIDTQGDHTIIDANKFDRCAEVTVERTIFINNSSDCSITNNQFHECGRTSGTNNVIYLRGVHKFANNTVISGNRFVRTRGTTNTRAIYIEAPSTSGDLLQNIIITGNVFLGSATVTTTDALNGTNGSQINNLRFDNNMFDTIDNKATTSILNSAVLFTGSDVLDTRIEWPDAASVAVDPGRSQYRTNGATPITTLTGGKRGQRIAITVRDGQTIKDGTGNILLDGATDVAPSGTDAIVELHLVTTTWKQHSKDTANSAYT